MDLTQNERAYAKKYLQRLEWESRQWAGMRWFSLVSSLLLIGLGIYFISQLHIIFSGCLYSFNPQNFNAKEVENFVNLNIEELRSDISFLIGFSLSIITGIIMLLDCIKNWNRHLKSGIMAKVLSRLFSEK